MGQGAMGRRPACRGTATGPAPQSSCPCRGSPCAGLTSISVTKAWGLSEVVGAGAALVRPRARESRWSSAGRRGAAVGSRSALWTSPSRRLLQLLGRLFCKRTKVGGWWCGGSLGPPLRVCLQAHVNSPPGPTSLVSMGRGRKGGVQIGGSTVPGGEGSPAPQSWQGTGSPLPPQPPSQQCHHPLQQETEAQALLCLKALAGTGARTGPSL